MTDLNIFLFHRDLRLTDNTSFIFQSKEEGQQIPIFIFPPEQIDPKKNKYFSNNSVQFMIESLHELSEEIKKHKGSMYFFKGDTMKVLKKIHKKFRINSIAYNLDYTPYARKRDEEIRKWCEKQDIKCYEKEDYALYDILNGQTKKKDGTPFLVYTPFRNHCVTNLEVRPVDKYKNFTFEKIKTSQLKSLEKYLVNEESIDNFYKPNKEINVNGGRSNGLKILNSLDKFKEYNKKRDNLTYKTTFLGAHNHFSTVSIREVYYKMVDKLEKKNNLINEIIWRDFYINVTYEFPHVLEGQIKKENKSYKKEYDNIKWSYDLKKFDKWCDGKTGFPIIDAAMKQLNTTGFMHNRARMFVASFLTKDLHLDWRMGEKYFASKLVDYDPMSNSGGWMWSTGNGTDAQPWFRIFNPWSQSEKFDPDAEYIKKWLPELSEIPAIDLHNWFKPEIHKKWLEKVKYFEPMVEHDKERLETIKLYKKGLK